MAYDLQEQEQLAALKAWWAKWGNSLLSVFTIVMLSLAAWNGWNWYQRDQAARAVVHFEALQQAGERGDLEAVALHITSLTSDYRRTGYAARGALIAAAELAAGGQQEQSRSWLQWVLDHSGEPGLQALARLRLAALLIDLGDAQAALATLEVSLPEAFAALAADRRGDALLVLGRTAEARVAYQEAVAQVTDPTLRSTIQFKLDALGEG